MVAKKTYPKMGGTKGTGFVRAGDKTGVDRKERDERARNNIV